LRIFIETENRYISTSGLVHLLTYKVHHCYFFPRDESFHQVWSW